jgi:diketogulonate reductase-like aldo/keto reductase
MGESRSRRAEEVAALRTGLELGLTVIDTAEMYASGRAEEVVAEAVSGMRDRAYVVSKVLPGNASRKGAVEACERSLRRLNTDRIDLYLLHWRGSYPLADTVEAFERLRSDGKIVDWGVSNFDVDDMAELERIAGADPCAANQVMYHAGERGIEYRLLPAAQKAGIVVMAYCPLGQGSLMRNATMLGLARKHGVAPSTIALAFLLSRQGVMAIPKSASAERVREFAAAHDVMLDDEDMAAIDKTFPPPRRKEPLAIT